jgi:hypothetical protein
MKPQFEYATMRRMTILTPHQTQADVRWNELLTSPEGQKLLLKLAYEAQQEYEAGQTTEIFVTANGCFAPELSRIVV